MRPDTKILIFFSALLVNALLIYGASYANEDLSDKSLEDLLQVQTELKADVGSRSGARNFLDSRSPLDVITYEQIEHSGLTTLTDVLTYFVAGFNAPETSVADGSDHVRAFTLRGMSPDQVLVLINGKRLHTSALLHANGTIGRGSSGVDLDTIVVGSIEKIEILRDGAAAQYGSDAISGVINIILKGIGHKNSVSANTGKRKAGDGAWLYTEIFASFPLKYDGFANVAVSAKKQDHTQRAGKDRRITPPSVQTHAGIPDSTNYLAAINVEMPQANDINIFFNGIFNNRDSKASTFFRPASKYSADYPEVLTLYPDGFLPTINAKILDYSFVAGVNGQFNDSTDWEVSNTYGYNGFHFIVDNSVNYTLGASSPTLFDAGRLAFTQNTMNLDLKKSEGRLDLAGGAEHRYENYQIQSGDLASYAETASQGFAGFSPDNSTDTGRNSYALYFDATYNFNNNFSLEGAGRHENYSDFGPTTNFKLASAYKISPEFLLRMSASTGFRAPSLAQSSYSLTSSFVDTVGNLSTQGTFKPDHEVSIALGAEALEPEKSRHFAIGGVYQPTKDISLMVDYYYTGVEDRIMLSDELSGSTPAQQAVLASHNISRARFLTNGVNTTTQGVDIKLNFRDILAGSSKLSFETWYHYNQNKVVGYNNSTLSKASSFEQISRVEDGQPKSSLKLLTNYEVDKFNITMNISRFGSYKQVRNGIAYEFDPAWTTDLDVAYEVRQGFSIAIGGINIFDKSPNKWKGLSGEFYGYDGIKPYSRYSPFGYSGAYYYIRTSAKF